MEKLRAGKRGSLDSQTRRITTPKIPGFDSPWTVVGTWKKREGGGGGGRGGIHSTKWRRIMMREYLREENSLVSVNLRSFVGRNVVEIFGGYSNWGEERRGERISPRFLVRATRWRKKKRKEKKTEGRREKFFWNDSIKPLEWFIFRNFLLLVVSPLPFTWKKICCKSRSQICYALFFPRTGRREKQANRGEIMRGKHGEKAIKNLVINKLIRASFSCSGFRVSASDV